MSREAAAEFLMHIRNNAETQEQIGPNPDFDTFQQVAGTIGLEFSADELRGVGAAEQFYLKASEDPALFKEVGEAVDESAVVALAAREGHECQVDDLKAVLLPHQGEELSDQDLEGIAGGGGFSYPDVCKTPAPPAPYVPIPYPSGW